MTYYPDLGPVTMVMRGPAIRAVGWLSVFRPVSRGAVDPAFVARLRDFCARWGESVSALHWPVAGGFHECELCMNFRAGGTLGVPAGDLLYVAPEMVLHYVERHGYAPPPAFVAAVMSCPLPGTPEYAALVLPFVLAERAWMEAHTWQPPPSGELPLAWDTSHDWVVRTHGTWEEHVVIVFEQAPPTIRELAAVRAVLPQYRDKPVAEVRAAVGAGGKLDLGEMSGFESRRIERDALAAGLKAVRTNVSRTLYSFLDRTAGTTLLVEDPAEAEKLAKAMMAAGVPVQHSVE